MEYINNNLYTQMEPCAVALGNFDGIHKGHRLLIEEVLKISKNNNYNSVVFSFYPHPSHLIKNKDKVGMIYSPQEKRFLLEEMNIDKFIEYPFDKDIATMEASVFVEEILLGKLNAKTIVVGENFRFGYKRQGDKALLEYLSKNLNFELKVISTRIFDGDVISSSLIRECIKKGEIEQSNSLLGNNYFMIGVIIKGKQLGRTIGFKTINIIPPEGKILPSNGVYITNTLVKGRIYNSITNAGVNPTVSENNLKIIETHLLDFEDEDIYNEQVIIYYYKKIRDEFKFSSVEELRKQILKDKNAAVKHFEQEGFHAVYGIE